ATWRASMLVFLYPENLLLPTLRPEAWKTPGFQMLAEALTGGGTLTPDAASQAAQQYSDYYQDVCTIVVEATCQTLTFRSLTDAPYLFYMFGRGGKTNRLYWATYNPDAANADYAQSAWIDATAAAGVGSMSLSGLIGGAPFITKSGRKIICLFL